MKSWVCGLLLALFANNALAGVHVVSKEAGIDITTDKVIYLTGSISPIKTRLSALQGEATSSLPGDRVLVINSSGGRVDVGEMFLMAIMAEVKVQGIRLICAVDGDASSMAFNILSFCDVRLSTAESTFIVHKIRTTLNPNFPFTPKILRAIARDLERADRPYALRNARLMGLSDKKYSDFADAETQWTAEQLRKMKYLHGFCTIEKTK